MSKTVIDILTAALRDINVIDADESPDADQGVLALNKLNEMMLDAQADGIDMGWYPIAYTDVGNVAPLRDEDIRAVQLCLELELCPSFGIEPLQQLKDNAGDAYAKLSKRYIRYMESDLTFLPSADAGYCGTSWPIR